MTRGPRRLKDDSDFQWETGCNIEDERLVVGEYDMSSVRARILAGVLATGAAATTAVIVGDGVPAVARVAGWSAATFVKPLLGVAAGSAILAGAYWLGMQSHEETGDPTGTPISAHEVPVTASMTTGVAPGRHEEPETEPSAPPNAPVVAPAITPRNQGSQPSAVLRTTPPETAPPPTGTAAPDALLAPIPRVEQERSNVPAQQHLIDSGAYALARHDYDEAERLFAQYLSEWPGGLLTVEAELGLLQARSLGQDYEGTAALAEKIQGDPAFAERREEILRLWAESLVQLDRCTEALGVADQLSARSAAPVRKSCRGVRREGD